MRGSRRKRNILRTVSFAGLCVLAAAGLARLPSATAFPTASFQVSRARPQADLEALLRKTADYCRKLESAAFDFVCLEEIRERIDPSLDIPTPDFMYQAVDWSWGLDNLNWPRRQGARREIKRSFLYDYQCVRSGGATREMRTLLEENGKKKKEPDAKLKTSVVVFGTVLMGPVGLFGERFQPEYDYSVSREDKVGKTKVVVIDAKPKPGAPETTNLYGKAWIDPATGDILRVEWSDSRVGHFDVLRKRGERYRRTPRLFIRSEFRAEKNGIRFPSRLYVEEAYLNTRGKAAIRSKTEVVYKDFKFFRVEVEVRY